MRKIDKIIIHCTATPEGREHSIGIAYAGGMDKSFKNPKDTRTHAQKEALIWLIDELKKRYPGSTVHGHNEYTSYKACPSFDVSKEGY